jgi:hypothetical protein
MREVERNRPESTAHAGLPRVVNSSYRMADGSLSLGNVVADITSTASGPSSTRCSDETDEARHRCLRGSENRRCWSSCVSILVDGAAEDTGAQESVDFEVGSGGGLLVGAGR